MTGPATPMLGHGVTTRAWLRSPGLRHAQRRLARVARNKRLADACTFGVLLAAGLTGCPGLLRPPARPGKTHHQALRSLGNRWVGILHGCLVHREVYEEDMGGGGQVETAA